MNKCLVSWSSGKDSAWLVHVLRSMSDREIGGLLTTINEAAQRVAMHAVRVELLEAQAEALGLLLWEYQEGVCFHLPLVFLPIVLLAGNNSPMTYDSRACINCLQDSFQIQ